MAELGGAPDEGGVEGADRVRLVAVGDGVAGKGIYPGKAVTGSRRGYPIDMSRQVMLFALFLAGAVMAPAQRGRVELRGYVGTTGFLDDFSDRHLLVGASPRAYFTQRLSIQPEYQFLNGWSHTDFGLSGECCL